MILTEPSSNSSGSMIFLDGFYLDFLLIRVAFVVKYIVQNTLAPLPALFNFSAVVVEKFCT